MTERQPVAGALLSDINLNRVRDHIDTASSGAGMTDRPSRRRT